MTQRKIDIFGQFRPTAADTSQADVFRSLAGLAGQATGLAIEKGLERRQEQGRLEGLQAGQQAAETGGKPEKRDAVFSVADKAYNEAALLSYRAGIRRDTKETLNRLQNEYELDPDAFRQSAAKYKQGILQGMPEEFQFVINDDIENEIASRGMQLDDRLYKFEKDQNIALVQEEAEDLKDDILNKIRQGDAAGAANLREQRKLIMDRAVANGYVSPQQAKADAEQMLEAITIHGEIGKLEGIFADPDLSMEEKIVKATMIVDSKKNAVYKDLDPQQRDALTRALKSELGEQIALEAEMNAQAQKEIALETVQLKQAAQFGTMPPSEINARAYDMFRNQLITEGEYQGITNDVLQYQQRRRTQAIGYQKVSERLAGNDAIVLSQKEVDDYYDNNIVPILDQLEPGRRATELANFAVLTGIIPNSMKNQIKNGLRSDNPDLIRESADIISRLDEARGIESPVTPHDRAFAQTVTSLSDYMAPEEAIKKAQQMHDPSNKAMIEFRQQKIKDEKFEEDYESKVDSAFDPIGPAGYEPDVTAKGQMLNDYKAIFEAHYLAGMDEDQAHATAEKLLKRNWEYSASSDRLMKYRPEDYYSVEGGTDYIKTQLEEDVRENFFVDGYQKVFLVSDSDTGRMVSSGKRPDYLVMVQTNDGQLIALQAPNQEKGGRVEYVRWSPDTAKQAEILKNKNLQEQMEIRSGAKKKKAIEAEQEMKQIEMLLSRY